jgi:hypothetical protein
MRTKASLFLALVLSVGSSACDKSADPQVAKPATLEAVPATQPTLTALPDPELQGGHVGRAPRRITTAQLKSSIKITTGRDWSQLENLAASLGRADYALVNAESVETNLVFAKFLEDGAREVCLGASDADLKQTDQAQRILSPQVPVSADIATLDAATLQSNLVYLSTRFWGEPLTGEELTRWTSTFQAIATRAKAAKKLREAWGAICIALMTDSRFVTY